MSRPFARAERARLARVAELLAVLAVAAAVYELAVAPPSTSSETYGEIGWCDSEYDYDGLAEWAGPQIDELAPASTAATVLPLGSESLPVRLVGLGCAMLGLAGSLYGRFHRDTGASPASIK